MVSKKNMVSKRKMYVEASKLFSLVSQIGIMIAVSTVGSTLFGRFLDSIFNTKPIMTLIFLVLGIAAGFLSVYKTLIVYTKRK